MSQVAGLVGLGLGTTLLTAALHGAGAPDGGPVAPAADLGHVGAVLLVDDDDGDPDVREVYTRALDRLGVHYRVWDTHGAADEPAAEDLVPFEVVIWFTGGAADTSTGPGPAAEAALTTFLDGGGRLLISSQDYFWARGGADGFPRTRLGIGRVDPDHDINRYVTGHAPPFEGWGQWPLSFPFDDFTDIVEPEGPASSPVRSDTGAPIAVATSSDRSRTLFLAFPLGAVSPAAARVDLLARFLTWDGELGGPTVFADGFETGDTSRWSAVVPPPPTPTATPTIGPTTPPTPSATPTIGPTPPSMHLPTGS